MLLTGVLPLVVSATQPWQQLTVYHVNPLHQGVLPVNMDTADLHGDMFFDLRSKVLPVECRNSSSGHHTDDCSNGEVVDADLVISKLSLQIRGDFGDYGRCNICGSAGVDPFSGLNCTAGSYFCTCGDYHSPYPCNNERRVGREDVGAAFGNFSSKICTWDRWVDAPWMCWGWPVVGKTGGMWYSTTEAGWCDAPGADPLTCTWAATVVKVVNKTCSDAKIYDAVEAYDAQRAQCFERCPAESSSAGRNTSDACWIYCFYATVLGAASLLPGGHEDGIPLSVLDEAFELPFLPEAEGGCPEVPLPLKQPPRAAGLGARPWDVQRAAMVNSWYRAAATAGGGSRL